TWIFSQKIVSLDRDPKDQFGWSVAISGDNIVVGARFEDNDLNGGTTQFESGSAYIFNKDASGYWTEQQKFIASDRTDFDQFGYDVAICDSLAFVGAYREDHDLNGTLYLERSGSAYVFDLNSSVGINEAHFISEANVYPNPSKGEFTIELQSSSVGVEVQIFDIFGRSVAHRQKKIEKKILIDIDTASGLYFAKINNEVGWKIIQISVH
ncbi:MAG: T9SS type A sorting domain-containing protein, partial [Bacteroidia bacterium]|nr:T9SS type A sorting domain-containing protein [Bacteroidia bacterium]